MAEEVIRDALMEMTREERLRVLVRVLQWWHWYKPPPDTVKKWGVRKRREGKRKQK